MRRKDILIGIAIVALALFASFWIRKAKLDKERELQIETPNAEERIKEVFNGYEVPDDVEKIELLDVSETGAVGIATRSEVLADLPDPASGYFYQVWMEKDGNLISLGKMRVAKGGFLFDGNISQSRVVVSREKTFDNKIEEKLLEGSF